jgi:phosphatidate cytidylyltransferase
MLKQRVITALLMLAVFLPALFATDTQLFMGLTLILISAGAWEWGRLNGWSSRGALLGALLCFGVCIWALDAGWVQRVSASVWLLSGGLWVLLGARMIQRGVTAWGQWPRLVRWLVGLALLAVAWLAMVQAHQRGVNFLLSVLVLVWAADVFAYFAGRALGGRWIKFKLAPAISPGKSWEGVLGGMVGVLVVAVCWVAVDAHWQLSVASFYTVLLSKGWLLTCAALMFMAAMSVVGDLVESLVKRSAGVKDSSALLPGHGGVLDRLDALLPTLPLAMMIVTWVEMRT